MKLTGFNSIDFTIKEVGVRLKGVRIRKGLTREELANNATVSLSTISRIENGDGCSLENLCRVMQALGILGNFQNLVKEYEPTFEELCEGKDLPKRVRKKSKSKEEWKWGDDE